MVGYLAKLAPKRTGWRIQHVKSHSKPKPGESFAEHWQRCHNDAADEAAKSVYRELPSQVADVLQNARQAYDEYIKLQNLSFHCKKVLFGVPLGCMIKHRVLNKLLV